MTTLRKGATALLVTAAVALEAGAQAPAPDQKSDERDPAPATAAAAYKRRSILQHYPHPYPGMYHGDQSAGFRNPGGTGRFLEFYPAGNEFQANQVRGEDPVRVATFGGGGVPDRNSQMAAQQLGVSRYNAIQGHIDRMAQPAFGYGFFGGFY